MKRIFGALTLAALIAAAIFLKDNPPERAPTSAPPSEVQNVLIPESAPVEKARTAPPPEKPPAGARRPSFDPAAIERHLSQTPKAEFAAVPSGSPDLDILPSLHAIQNKNYATSMGPELRRQSGYVLFQPNGPHSSIHAFDGIHLPVVQYRGRAALGVVTGEIEVVFRELPEDLNAFARQQNLNLAAEIPNIKTAIFTARSYPADLAKLAQRLKRHPSVDKAEVSVLFGSRRGS